MSTRERSLGCGDVVSGVEECVCGGEAGEEVEEVEDSVREGLGDPRMELSSCAAADDE